MIYLLRHGEILGAEVRRYMGRTDIGLSPRGVDQARYWHRFLGDVAFDNVFASPLSRTLDTACIVSGLPADRVCITKEFQEIDLGDWDGVEVRCIKDQYPQAWDARGKDMAGFRPPGGESFSDLEARVMPAFVGLVSGMPGNCLVVAHAGVNRVILTRLLGKNLEDLFSIPQGYGALNIIHSRNLCVQSVNLLPQ